MNKYKYLLPILLMSTLSGCNIIFETSTDDSSSTNDYDSSIFNTSDSIEDSSTDNSSVLDSSSDTSNDNDYIPTNFYTIDQESIIKTYYSKEKYPLKENWICFIILDSQGRIAYTASNTKAGFGGIDMYYSHPLYHQEMEYNVDNDYVTIPMNCTGYSISLQDYADFASQVSDGEITFEVIDDASNQKTHLWNSLENPYFDNYTGVKIGNVGQTTLNVKNSEVFRLSSLYDDIPSNGIATYKMYAPYDDNYKISCNTATNIQIYNSSKSLIANGEESVEINLKKDDIVYVSIKAEAEKFFKLVVTLKDHSVELPYEINSKVNISDYSTKTNNNYTGVKAATLNYTKRSDERGLYVNSNNPENLTEYQNKYGSILNTVLMRQDVTERDVFFTFEHNNLAQNYYYGYRVTNTGEQDVYITVKNLGYQVNGAGSWLGEDEWIKFYNTKFDSNTSSYTSSQKSNYDAYVGFSNAYKSENRKPITYRLPKGKYIYVMGGTTKDAYQKINVFNSANRTVYGGCSNGAVLFSVTGGTAEASFMLYTDSNASTINSTNYVTGNNQIGYVSDDKFGVQYGGYDDCHGVVDADIVYEFNDKISSGYLPVTYTNPYNSTVYTGTRYGKLTNMSPKTNNGTSWKTHISNFDDGSRTAVGTDMTDYINVDFKTKQKIEIDSAHYDGRGKHPNIGNWMVDYIDTFTLVNQGNKDREIRYELKHNGVILAFIRDENGFVDNSLAPKYYVSIPSTQYGSEIREYFTYTIKVPANSIVRFSVDYNLLANSNGTITHKVYLA